jgi:hypothetical protein
MMLAENEIIEIRKAEYVGAYKIHLLFSDDQERIVDFEPFLRNSLNPMIQKYLNLDHFQNFTVEYGDLFWNEYDLCFPIGLSTPPQPTRGPRGTIAPARAKTGMSSSPP